MIHRLSVIIRKSYNKKYKKGYVDYLNSLNYDEFKEIYIHYLKVLIRYENIYKTKNKPKFFSKNWFKNKSVQINVNRLYHIFSITKNNYMKQVLNELENFNNKRETIVNKIFDLQNKINNLSTTTVEISQNSPRQEIIKFYLLFVENFDFKDQIEKLNKELDDMDEFF